MFDLCIPTDVKAYLRRIEDACDKLDPRLEFVALRCRPPPPCLELFEKLLCRLLFEELLSFWLVSSVSVFFILFLLTTGAAFCDFYRSLLRYLS